MALSKKKSRLITIDSNQYRWLVSSNSGFNVFVAEKEAAKGRNIEVYFDRYINKHKGRFVPGAEKELKIIKPNYEKLLPVNPFLFCNTNSSFFTRSCFQSRSQN